MNEETTQKRRFLRAVLIVGVICVGMLAWILNGPAKGNATSQDLIPIKSSSTMVSSLWSGLQEGRSIDEMLIEAGFEDMDAKNAPDWMDEILDRKMLDGFNNVITNGDRSLIEFRCGKRLSEMEAAIESDLGTRGWLACESGYDDISTYTKKEGECTWLMMKRTETEDGASILMHIKHT